jgi:hypothetical protein
MDAIDAICREIFAGRVGPCPAVAPRSTTENRGVASSILALATLNRARLCGIASRRACADGSGRRVEHWDVRALHKATANPKPDQDGPVPRTDLSPAGVSCPRHETLASMGKQASGRSLTQLPSFVPSGRLRKVV